MNIARLLLVLCLAVLASGCGAIVGIFKAGFWTGIILVVLIVLVVAFLASKLRRR
jgi:hypothetical protein